MAAPSSLSSGKLALRHHFAIMRRAPVITWRLAQAVRDSKRKGCMAVSMLKAASALRRKQWHRRHRDDVVHCPVLLRANHLNSDLFTAIAGAAARLGAARVSPGDPARRKRKKATRRRA